MDLGCHPHASCLTCCLCRMGLAGCRKELKRIQCGGGGSPTPHWRGRMGGGVHACPGGKRTSSLQVGNQHCFAIFLIFQRPHGLFILYSDEWRSAWKTVPAGAGESCAWGWAGSGQVLSAPGERTPQHAVALLPAALATPGGHNCWQVGTNTPAIVHRGATEAREKGTCCG